METQLLEKAGLTEGESKVYLSLLELGLSTSGPITEKSGVARSIIYQLLEKLIKKGLVSFVTKQKTKYFQAANPEKLLQYVHEQEEQLSKTKEELHNFLPQLQLLKSKTESEAKIYEGFKGFQSAFEHTYDTLKPGESYSILGIPSFQPEKYHWYYKRDHLRREKAKINCKLLFNRGTAPEIIKNRDSFVGSEAKIMPMPLKTPAWFLIYKDVVTIGLQSKEIAIEITDQEIASSFQAYFDSFWNQKTRTYDGNEGIKEFFTQLLNYEDVWFMGGNFGINTALPKFWKQYKKKRVKAKCFWHDLIDKSATEIEDLRKEPYYEARVLPTELQSPHVIVLFGNFVANILWDKEKTVIFVFENENISKSYHKQFDYFWKKSAPY